MLKIGQIIWHYQYGGSFCDNKAVRVESIQKESITVFGKYGPATLSNDKREYCKESPAMFDLAMSQADTNNIIIGV